MVGEDAYALTLRFAGEPLKLFSFGVNSDVGEFGLVFTRVAVDRVVHEFQELLLHLGIGGEVEIGVVRNVGLQPA